MSTASAARTALQVADWRRRVAALYSRVRETADAALAHRVWREGRDELFLTHPASPLLPEARRGFEGLPVADYDPAWRVEAEVLPAPEGGFSFATGTDGTVSFERVGRIALPGLGDLDAWRLTSYGGGIFLPLRDGLAGRGTYGGGRYVLDTVKGADLGSDAAAGTLVVDLNFAYNPSCAYDPAWACPLAPPTNTVAGEVPVGELYSPPAE